MRLSVGVGPYLAELLFVGIPCGVFILACCSACHGCNEAEHTGDVAWGADLHVVGCGSSCVVVTSGFAGFRVPGFALAAAEVLAGIEAAVA